MSDKFKVGIVGARGYVGAELVKLLVGHDGVELACVVSRSLAGKPVEGTHFEYVDPTPERAAALDLDAWILALPNGESAPWVAALHNAVLIDLSTDHRCDAAWQYGLVELRRERLRGARRIANPGCYATGIALALAPFAGALDGPPLCFGVSGHSGAGATPSPRNDPEQLRDNVVPYSLVGHAHEAEVARLLGRSVRLLPHVAPWFRGISLTIHVPTTRPIGLALAAAYVGEPLVRVVDDIPVVQRVAGKHHVEIGVGGEGVVVVTLDNLLKGAATQALQNLNLALGLDELAGIPVAT